MLVRYKIFDEYPEIFAFTTTKQTLGVNKVRYSDQPENKSKLAQYLQIKKENLIFPKQTHTNCVAEISETSLLPFEDTDALICTAPGICIAVQTADCVPVLLYDPKEKVIAAVHAGWRGTVKKILAVAIQKMQKNGSEPKNIIAAIGPSISQKNYEVGPEVISEVKKHIPLAENTFQNNNNGKFLLDLWKANYQFLRQAGLPERNIQILGECSYANKGKYYSARREGDDTGRLVSGIMVNEEMY